MNIRYPIYEGVYRILTNRRPFEELVGYGLVRNLRIEEV